MLIAPLLAISSTAVAAPKINYQDNALPLFRNSCLGCHNPDKKKGGLDLTSWQAAMAGGSDGAVINPGDADGSMLYRVVTHEDEPAMPPKADKLPQAQLDIIKQWILAGALPTANGKPGKAAKAKIDLTFNAAAGRKPAGTPAMPHDMLMEAIVHAQRPGALCALAASPWAPVVALSGQHEVLLYNPQTLALLGVLPFTEGQPQVLNFSANGSLLLVGGGQAAKSGKVVLWDVASGNRVTDVGDEFDAVLAADISPDQSRVALGGPNKLLKVYSTKDGSLIDTIKSHTDWVTAAAYSPDGVMFASGDRAGGLWIWEAKTDREFYNLAGHKAGVTAVAWRPDSNVLASASEDGTIKLWDMNSGKEARSWQAHGGGVLCVNFAGDGRIVSCGRDHVVRLWKPDGSPLKDLGSLPDIALKAVFSNDGNRVIAGDFSGVVQVFDVSTGKPVDAIDSNPPPLADRITAAAQKLAQLQPPADKATADLAAARDAQQKSQQATQAGQAALDTVKKAVDDGKARVATMQNNEHAANDALNAQRQAVASSESNVNRLNTVMQQATAARQTAQQEADAAHNAMPARQQAIDAATKALVDAKAVMASAPAATQPPATQPATTQPAPAQPDNTAVAQAQAALDKANADMAQARQLDSDKANQLKQKVDALARAQTDVAQANTQLADARKGLADKDKAHADAVAQLQTAQQTLTQAQNNQPSAEKQLAAQQDQQKNADQRVAQASAAADAAGQQLSAAKGEVARLKAGQFFTSVYAARKVLNDQMAQQEQMSQALAAAQAAIDKANGDMTTAQQAFANAPARIAAKQAAINKATDAMNAANANVSAAQATLARRQSLQTDATALSQRIRDEASKSPDDKALADVAAKGQTAIDALNGDLVTAKQFVDQKTAEAKLAADGVAAAQADLAKEQADIAAAPQKIEALKAAVAAAQADLPPKKSALDDATHAVETAKAKADQLETDYRKLTQQAGGDAAPQPPGKT
jgi:WD40 repeat protein